MQVVAATDRTIIRPLRTQHVPALLIGQPSPVKDALETTLSDHGVPVLTEPAALASVDTDEATIVAIIRAPRPPRRSGLYRWRERAAEQAAQDRITGAVVEATGNVSTSRLLIICDASSAPSSTRSAATTRQLCRRIAYECELNGSPIDSTGYVVVDDIMDATTVVHGAVTWHFARP